MARYVQPSGVEARIYGCPSCKARIYAENDSRPGMASLRCGTLDNSSDIRPAAHIWVKSKQKWLVLPDDARSMEDHPETAEEWVKLVGIVGV